MDEFLKMERRQFKNKDFLRKLRNMLHSYDRTVKFIQKKQVQQLDRVKDKIKELCKLKKKKSLKKSLVNS